MYTRQNNDMEKNYIKKLHNPNVNGKVVIFFCQKAYFRKRLII